MTYEAGLKLFVEGGSAVETTISRRSSSGVGIRSNRSTRSEDDVFADAVTDFVDSPGLGEVSDGVVHRENSLQNITENDPDGAELTAINGINGKPLCLLLTLFCPFLTVFVRCVVDID